MTDAQTSTLLFCIGVLLVGNAGMAVALLWKEYKTLTDDIPGNHITAAVRTAWRRQPGAFLPLIVFAALTVAYLGAHFFWSS